MKSELADLLKKAEKLPGWTKNSTGPWNPIVAEFASSIGVSEESVHACKVQISSARKSLWQGRLHRSPVSALFLAADFACDDAGFDRLSSAVIERFSPPTHWADACIVMSSGKVLGCVERDGVGLSEWLATGNPDLLVETCNSVDDQLPLGTRVNAKAGAPAKFIKELEAGDKKKIAALVGDLLGLDGSQVLVSIAEAPANAAKGRWEGADVDPDVRYRVAVVSAEEWEWGNASMEIMRRMEPPELTIGVAILYAKSAESGPWNRCKAFVNKNYDDADDVLAALRRGKVSDVLVLDPPPTPYPTGNRGEDGRKLRLRDADAGSIRYEASRPKQRVHDAVTNWLAAWGEQENFRIEEGDESEGLYDALVKGFYQDADLLVEVKSTADLGVIRLAVGQLIDYGRVLKKAGIRTSGTVLIPPTERLTDDQKELLSQCGFAWSTLIHRKQGGKTMLVLEIHNADGSTYSVPKQV